MMSPLPKAKAKPIAQYISAAIEKFVRIFATTVPAFFAREKPISRNAKPACMKITSRAATTTQTELIATLSGRAPAAAASFVSANAAPGIAAQASAAPSSAAPVLLRISPPLPDSIQPEWWFGEDEGSLSRCRRFPVGVSPSGRAPAPGRRNVRDLWTHGQGPGGGAG